MTFAELEYRVRLVIRQGAVFNVKDILRDGENNYIKRTWCNDKLYSASTSDLNGGTLDSTYSLPSGFVREFRVEWDGIPLQKETNKTKTLIFDSSNDEYTGTPVKYWLEDDTIRFIPEPSAHGYWTMWYVAYNTVTDGTSPIIPEIDQENLVDYAIWKFFESVGEFELADRYEARYLRSTKEAFQRYRQRRGVQRRMITGGGLYVNRYQDEYTEE